MNEGQPFVVPWVTQTSHDRVPKIDLKALRMLAPEPGALLPHCVPSPFAEAEVMTILLRALPTAAGHAFEDPKPTLEQRQCVQRWEILLKAMLLGRVNVENVALDDAQVDNFGRALLRSRARRGYQGVLRSTEIPALNVAGRRSRLVGGVDEYCLVWAAPRLQDSAWGFIQNTIQGADNGVALDLLAAWKAMLVARGLWSQDSWNAPWMRGVDRMLEGHKPSATWEQLQGDVRMAGPLRLNFPHAGDDERQLDVFLPVYARGYAVGFQEIFRLRPEAGQGGVDLVEDRSDGAPARRGRYIQLTSVQRSSLAPGAASATHVVAMEDALLAGLGQVTVVDERIVGERWWLQDRDGVAGYKSAVYLPLLQQVLQAHGAGLQLAEQDVADAPIFFPDALRLARGMLNPPPGKSGVEYVTLKDKHGARVRHWPLPMYGQQLMQGLVLPPPNETFVLALENSPSAPCMVERLDNGGGVMLEVGELRALGALLWEMFTGEAESKPGSLALQRTALSADGVDKVASQARESEPRMIFNDALLASVGSVLSDQAGRSDSYRARVRKRRATAQRFLALWSAAEAQVGPEWWLAALAAKTFLQWAFQGSEPPEPWGRSPELDAASERRLLITRALQLPVFADVYPRRV